MSKIVHYLGLDVHTETIAVSIAAENFTGKEQQRGRWNQLPPPHDLALRLALRLAMPPDDH